MVSSQLSLCNVLLIASINGRVDALDFAKASAYSGISRIDIDISAVGGSFMGGIAEEVAFSMLLLNF
eukprot:CAMPEP_0202460512 /NCGR_PEP_ID=MMETSP1360-20130828/44406_1 /ASSEMBLY_ACC=CAM_ASM_000848 /TAXON_ID=515479 /ORGANISM="Licmophora paradoxa, Strain CCMP2313" /LENGTH=66 /DNA_ID=CAMNT_0049082199 /DNA_START=169 /DNA_END=369 /DNA_ORIENTATION=+